MVEYARVLVAHTAVIPVAGNTEAIKAMFSRYITIGEGGVNPQEGTKDQYYRNPFTLEMFEVTDSWAP